MTKITGRLVDGLFILSMFDISPATGRLDQLLKDRATKWVWPVSLHLPKAEFLTLSPLYPVPRLHVARIVNEVPTSSRGVFLTGG